MDTPSSVTVPWPSVVRSGPGPHHPEYQWPDHRRRGQPRTGEHTVEVDDRRRSAGRPGRVRVPTSFVNPAGPPPPRACCRCPSRPTAPGRVCVHGGAPGARRPKAGPTSSACPRHRPDASCRPAASRWRTTGSGVRAHRRGRDTATTLALTVLRSTGMLSRLGMAYRPFPAGPLTPAGPPDAGQRSPCVTRWPSGSTTPTPWPMTCCSRWSRHQLGRRHPPRLGTRWRAGAEVERSTASRGPRGAGLQSHRATTTVGHRRALGLVVDLRGYPKSPFEGSLS